MEFKFDMSKIIKVVMDNNDGFLIEYSLKDGMVVDAAVVKKEKAVCENIKESKTINDVKEMGNTKNEEPKISNNTDFKHIANIMKMDDKMDAYAKENREMIEKNGIHTQYEISENMHDAMVDEYVLKHNEMESKMKESKIPNDNSKVIVELDKSGYFDSKMTADEKIEYLKEALKKITENVNE